MSALTIAINLVGNNLAGGAFSGLTTNITRATQFAGGLNQMLKSLKGTTGDLMALTAGAGVTFGLFSSALEKGFTNAADLQDELLTLKQAIQANSDAMPVLTQSVNDLGVKTVYSSGEAADAFALLIRSGFNASQVMYGAGAAADEYKQHAYDATEATHGLGFEALALGQALHVSATDGANIASAALHTFNQEIQNSKDPTKAASGIINDLAGAYLNGAQSGEDLLGFLQQLGPTAASTGVSFKDMVTTGDVLAQAMGDMSQAGTRLRYFLSTLIHPTTQQAKEMANLGINLVNTSGAYRQLESELIKTGGASKDQIKLWDGSVSGLQKMFTAAQNVGLVPLDATFNSWAAQNDFLNSKLYDSQGNFLGLQNAVDQLFTALKDKTPEERTKALADLFNVRGGDAGRILANMTDFDTKYKAIWDRISKTDAVDMAMQRLDTFKGAAEALKDSLNSGLAVALLGILDPVTKLTNKLNDLVGAFLNAPPQVQTAVGIFLIAGTVLSGVALAIGGIATIIGILAPIFAAVGVSVGTLVGIFLAVPAVIVLVAGAFAGLYLWFQQHQDVMAAWGQAFSTIGSFANLVWTIFKSHLLPVLSELWNNLKTNMLPVWNDLSVAFQQAQPYLIAFAEVLGLVLVSILGFSLAVVSGLLVGLADVLAGIVKFGAGLIEAVTGAVAFMLDLWGGFFTVMQDIFTGNWSKLGADAHQWLTNLQSDVGTILSGLVEMAVGIFQGFIQAGEDFGKTFWDTIVNWFKALYDTLVGHSIVPDLINAIVHLFTGLPGRVAGSLANFVHSGVQAAQDLATKMLGAVGDLGGKFHDVGVNLVQGFINGISSMGANASGALKNLMSNGLVAAKHALNIKSPSGVFHEVGQQTIQGFINGVLALQQNAQDTMTKVLTFSQQPSVNVSSLGVVQAQAASRSAPASSDQPINIYLDRQNKLASYVFDKATGRLKQAGLARMRS